MEGPAMSGPSFSTVQGGSAIDVYEEVARRRRALARLSQAAIFTRLRTERSSSVLLVAVGLPVEASVDEETVRFTLQSSMGRQQ